MGLAGGVALVKMIWLNAPAWRQDRPGKESPEDRWVPAVWIMDWGTKRVWLGTVFPPLEAVTP